ncbi:hypothetical protein EOPP23_06585 [Endozoicomonas sp. OPT23]|uniref:tetratricopeptide repeat protein n=1 Tax=Endozoicomonas sp. OPT23 TaxID=2072845 RepID=UPI00129A8036|nr:SEL1-like repeat protein [Endozoicomonas sp. OPT23]MRI32653.1 hypothetical protein [Endozoicomonas sp. OPT23]
MPLSFTRHSASSAETGRNGLGPSIARLSFVLSLALALGGCTVLEKRTEAELAYEYQLNSYQLKAPEMALLSDHWLLTQSRQSYLRLANVLPELTPDLQPVENTKALDPSEQLVFHWLEAQLKSSPRNADAKAHYALLVWLGYGNEKIQIERNKKALSLLKQVNSSNAFSQYLTGVIQLNLNPAEAEKQLRKSSAQNYAPAQLALARLYLGQTLFSKTPSAQAPANDSGRLPLNDHKARTQLTALLSNRSATSKNHQQAKTWLAVMNFYGIGGSKNTGAAYGLLSADTKVSELLYLKALMQMHGIGTKANPQSAESLLKAATRAGSLNAANELALTLFNSDSTDSDASEGKRYLQQAAAKGSAIAAYNLGLSLYDGINQPANLNAAEVWINTAADQKLLEAIRASLYLKLSDRSWFPDKQETAALKQQLEHLALQGDRWSSYALGTLLLQGQGQPVNLQSGYAWLNVAVALGYQPAATLRDTAALQLSRPELNQAQTLSQSFFDRIQQVEEGTES